MAHTEKRQFSIILHFSHSNETPLSYTQAASQCNEDQIKTGLPSSQELQRLIKILTTEC